METLVRSRRLQIQFKMPMERKKNEPNEQRSDWIEQRGVTGSFSIRLGVQKVVFKCKIRWVGLQKCDAHRGQEAFFQQKCVQIVHAVKNWTSKRPRDLPAVNARLLSGRLSPRAAPFHARLPVANGKTEAGQFEQAKGKKESWQAEQKKVRRGI